MKKNIKLMIIGVTIMLCCYIGYHFLTSRNIVTDEKLSQYIMEQQGVENVSILARSNKADLQAVLYHEDGKDKLWILERDEIFKNRYRYYGGGFHSAPFATNHTADSKYGTLIIAYGNNSQVKAYSYELNVSGKKYIKENLGDYILDIYLLDGYNLNSEGCIYDKNHQIIMGFNECADLK